MATLSNMLLPFYTLYTNLELSPYLTILATMRDHCKSKSVVPCWSRGNQFASICLQNQIQILGLIHLDQLLNSQEDHQYESLMPVSKVD
jgi:hypothetical protein